MTARRRKPKYVVARRRDADEGPNPGPVRVALGLTQEQMALLLFSHSVTISRWESGRYAMPPNSFAAVLVNAIGNLGRETLEELAVSVRRDVDNGSRLRAIARILDAYENRRG